ncbi:MAG: c-type cytochrome [Pseudomonadota bacterium]
MRSTASLTVTLGALIALGLSTAARAEGASGQTIGLTCMVCHGDQGLGTKTIPALAGRNADQVYEALIAFKTGKRPATVMDRHAKGYSDEELRAVADYFASLPAK